MALFPRLFILCFLLGFALVSPIGYTRALITAVGDKATLVLDILGEVVHIRSAENEKYKVGYVYDYTDLVEPFGIDESWLDVTASLKLFGSGKAIADKIDYGAILMGVTDEDLVANIEDTIDPIFQDVIYMSAAGGQSESVSAPCGCRPAGGSVLPEKSRNHNRLCPAAGKPACQ